MSTSPRSRFFTRLRAAGIALAVLGALTIAACSADEPTPTSAPAPTDTPRPTPTATPAATATATPVPPTATATAVPTPTPTATPVPTPTSTPAPEDFVLHIIEPVAEETLTTNPTLLVSGRTRVDAVVSVNDTFVEPDINGLFSTELTLDDGPNIVEVVASISTGEQLSVVLVVIYEP
ncbi:MAG: hypothetical protein IIC95_10230 [Chloroflexi bacterium]|nr:hypothetical protein [Chloroflexota bacterium]